jgi:carboxyl-terminal processing protease
VHNPKPRLRLSDKDCAAGHLDFDPVCGMMDNCPLLFRVRFFHSKELVPMNKFPRYWALCVALLALMTPVLGLAQQPTGQLVAVEQLKSEAFKAFRGGQFDRTSELLNQAASLSKDPSLAQMKDWIQQFQSQRNEFIADRTKAYDKAVGDVKKLQTAGYEDAALDKAKDAGLLVLDKDAFRKEPWVVELIGKAVAEGKEYETKEQWIKAQRIYSDLGSLEPLNTVWKDKFKSATTRLRLLAMYTPEEFKRMVEDEVKQREAADQLINPTTQPATKPAQDENDSFKTDWRDMLRGVKMEMLLDALDDAQSSYWKDVTYKTLTLGGLKGLQTLATTKGLEKQFPGLAEENRRGQFLATINQGIDKINKAGPAEEARALRQILQSILTVNGATLQFPEEVIVNEFGDGAFAELDPFSTIIWPSDWDEFNKQVQGEFSGVGIQIQLDDDGNLKVVSPLEDSPAWRKKIQAGDIITHIDGKSARGITINQAVKNITGPSGTTVRLTMKSPDGTVREYPIVRETIHVASVKGYQHLPGGGWDYFIDPQQKIAYTRLTNFTKTTDEELTKALGEMQQKGARAIVIDLRNNPGGLLTAATDVCDKFLAGGTIVSTKGERELPNQPPIEARNEPTDIKLPVVVLVNQFSASASEIVSGALQDQHRAIIVGERSFGKGSVQMLFPLAGKSAALKLTTSHYYLPSGRCIHKEDNSTVWGVDPDLTVEMTTDQMRAANEARVEKEVLRVDAASAAPTTAPKKDLLATDPQLSAAVLLLKLELAGGTM